MLFLLTILFVATAVVSIAVLLKVQKNRQPLSSNNPKEIKTPIYRSIFEPDEAEISTFKREEKAQLNAENLAESKRLLAEKAEKVRDSKIVWQSLPNRKNTVALLYLASQSESGEVYAATANEISEVWKAGKITDLSANDLAEILESQFWLLPIEQRTSGVRFGLHQEIAGLRLKFSETK